MSTTTPPTSTAPATTARAIAAPATAAPATAAPATAAPATAAPTTTAPTGTARLLGRGTRSSLADPFAALLPGMTAAVSVLGDPLGVRTLAATSSEAAACAQTQIDHGEGPVWVARTLRRPVLESDAVAAAAQRWPDLVAVLVENDVRSVFAFPMTVGSLDVGVVSLYATRTRRTAPADLQDTLALVQLTARTVLRRALDSTDTSSMLPREILSRREIQQATGILLARHGISADEALLHLRAHAHATGTTVRAVARGIVTRRLDPAGRAFGGH